MTSGDRSRPAVFLDRDGTINLDPGYLARADRVRLFEGVPEALQKLRSLGLVLVVISNQSGIGRGLVTPDQAREVNRRVFELAGAEPDGIYWCPHHPTEAVGEYRTGCSCRKPATGLVDRAVEDHGIDLGRSFFVGDSEVDISCGRAAGVRTILVKTGLGPVTLEKVRKGLLAAPDHVAPDLLAAAEWISARLAGRSGEPTLRGAKHDMREKIDRAFRSSAEVLASLVNISGPVERAATLIIESLRSSGKLMICGYGGSAADSQHIAAELSGRFCMDRRALAAIALTTNTSNLTSIANDMGYENTFSRQVEGLGRAADVLLAISTSGNSPNVIKAMEAARALGMKTISLTGARECTMDQLADVAVKVPSTDTPRIQEGHIAIGHILCQLVEESFVSTPWEPDPGRGCR
ncbi:MAG: HAD-IIIA family hydrolase [Candidatus Riflebacteria bacterium]|nr:HAD-IIIA family hydrolase [Candidatus Riflebacteria bacterium]